MQTRKPPMLAPDPATRRAVEKAAEAARKSLVAPGTCMNTRDACDASPCPCARDATIEALAAFLDAMGQDIAAARVRRCLNTDGKEGV
jgi:hypothetical protein